MPLSSVARLLLGGRSGVQQDVAFDPYLLDQIELALEEVDVFLLAFQDVEQQVA